MGMFSLCIPQLHNIKVGFKGVYISRICFPDVSINNLFAPLIHIKKCFLFILQIIIFDLVEV